ncbi:MAG: penicillin-binding protein, partial [Clostridia bacterium]|nr:penicillin-binding protein [Clostridia bacterium]
MKKAVKVFSFLFISIAFLFLLVLLLVFFYVKRNIDFSSDEELFISSKNFESTVFYANSGTDGEYVPIISENTGSLKKSYALIDEIPESLKKGFIAVEDRRFYEHCGIDLKRTILAASNYLFKREKIFGASTITQQVIKNISGDNEIKLSRKFSEILRALHIEKCFGKDEILEVYLNIIPMSEEIYGAKEAAKCFFGKELSNLSVAQIATIIGVTNAPTAYNPYSNPDNCLKKRNSVLSVMFSEGVIGKNEYDKAMAEELSVIPKETREDRYDSWFTEAVIDSVSADLAKEKGISVNASRLLIVSGGYSIYTTM